MIMARYVDGFVLIVPKKNIAAYRRLAQKAGRMWRKHGALEFRECVGEDLKPKGYPLPFTRLMRAKPTETVVFSYIVFKSRAHRDRVNAKVMKDPQMTGDAQSMPFDMKRMAYGGFTTLVEL
jgi:uncharacterized protein YbaA (DUF1428 family)